MDMNLSAARIPSTVKNRLAAILLTSFSVTVFAPSAWAQTQVTDPWIRGTVAQQKATGMFATLTSVGGGRLVSGSSPVAGIVEIHEMKMEGTTMRMRAIDGLDLPAGKPVELKPGGFHLMLMDLKQPLKAGDTVPLTLVVEGVDRQRSTVELKVPVRALNASSRAGEMGSHQHHQHGR
jgi:periplasmic copper chaperone A